MRYQVSHITAYEYHSSVAISHHQMRLRPRERPRQKLVSHELQIEPAPKDSTARLDFHGNPVNFATIETRHSRLLIRSKFEVEVMPRGHPPARETPAWEHVRESNRGVQTGAGLEANEFLYDSPLVKAGDAFADYARPSFTKGRPILEAAMDLTSRIFKEFKFDPTATDVSTPISEVLRLKRGVCQDFAHLQIACLRSMGLAARYVSGYLNTRPPPGKTKLAGADASHAWLALYCSALGWIELDPTNNMIPGDEHITVAWGRDYGDVCPVRGVTLGSGGHNLDVYVDVTGVEEASASPLPTAAAAEPRDSATRIDGGKPAGAESQLDL
jgi:transglutaminase-like putative cysteine protease